METLSSRARGEEDMGAVRAMLIVMSMALMTSQALAKYVLGPGGISCGAWLETRRSQGATEVFQVQGWVLGYVSGANAGRNDDTDFLVEPDAEALFAWLDNYCRQHPLDKLTTASNALIHDLTMRAAVAKTKTK
jgi:hypothetical protein